MVMAQKLRELGGGSVWSPSIGWGVLRFLDCEPKVNMKLPSAREKKFDEICMVCFNVDASLKEGKMCVQCHLVCL